MHDNLIGLVKTLADLFPREIFPEKLLLLFFCYPLCSEINYFIRQIRQYLCLHEKYFLSNEKKIRITYQMFLCPAIDYIRRPLNETF
jgi:hypothetical protein